MMGMCEATKPDDDELVSVAKSYLSMNDSKIFSSEIANDPGTYIFLSARPRSGASNGRRLSGWVRRSKVIHRKSVHSTTTDRNDSKTDPPSFLMDSASALLVGAHLRSTYAACDIPSRASGVLSAPELRSGPVARNAILPTARLRRHPQAEQVMHRLRAARLETLGFRARFAAT
jgi:hypothetical protein